MKPMNGQAWQGFLGRKWAQQWSMTDRTFRGLTERMEPMLGDAPGRTLLDVGCGAGELVERMARAHPKWHLTGVDISPELIDVARARCGGLAGAQFHCADATRWTPDDGRLFDLVVARHVVMFFDDPVAAFAHLRALTAPGGRLVFSCFRRNEENGWIAALLAALPTAPGGRLGSNDPGPLAFADAGRVEALLGASGWASVELTPFDYDMIVGEGEDPIGEAVAYLLEIGPASVAAAGFTPDEREGCIDAMRSILEGYRRDDGSVGLPAATWLVSARRP